jgi:ribosomal-protein-alanine N-acetyltransferase
MPDRIVTKRLVLRRARMEDVADMHAVLSDPVAMRYWSSLPHDREEQSVEWVQSMVESKPEESDDFVVTLGGRVIGKMGAYRLPFFGFILSPEEWGKGLASEALSAFLDHRRSVAPGSVLEADVDPRNGASLSLLEKHGFVETGRAKGTWTIGDEICDSIYLSAVL